MNPWQSHTNYLHLWMLTWTWELLTDIITHIEDTAKNPRMFRWEMYLGNATGQFAPPAKAICTLQSLWVGAITTAGVTDAGLHPVWRNTIKILPSKLSECLLHSFVFRYMSIYISVFYTLKTDKHCLEISFDSSKLKIQRALLDHLWSSTKCQYQHKCWSCHLYSLAECLVEYHILLHVTWTARLGILAHIKC